MNTENENDKEKKFSSTLAYFQRVINLFIYFSKVKNSI